MLECLDSKFNITTNTSIVKSKKGEYNLQISFYQENKGKGLLFPITVKGLEGFRRHICYIPNSFRSAMNENIGLEELQKRLDEDTTIIEGCAL